MPHQQLVDVPVIRLDPFRLDAGGEHGLGARRFHAAEVGAAVGVAQAPAGLVERKRPAKYVSSFRAGRLALSG